MKKVHITYETVATFTDAETGLKLGKLSRNGAGSIVLDMLDQSVAKAIKDNNFTVIDKK